jgi:NAD dependent epimerase/dehydratase family enzyme
VPVPAFALQLLFGEMARDTILASQRAQPDALRQSGYSFRFPTLEQALRHELAR